MKSLNPDHSAYHLSTARNTHCKQQNTNKINDENFYFHTTPLYEHSKAEGKYNNISKGLINHLSEKNHIVLANLITNHFCDTKLNSIFHEKFILKKINDEFQYTEVTDNNYCEFIYE